MMSLQKLASKIAKREGKKSQARIGDIREILKLLVTFEINALEEKNMGISPIASLAVGVLKRTKSAEYGMKIVAVPLPRKKKKTKNAVSRRRSR